MKVKPLNEEEIIKAYNDGQSMNAIAKKFYTHAMTINRILKKHGIALRHDSRKNGELYVKDGEKLLEYAKAQGRLVTKKELADVIGVSKLSPSYFIKYPELGQYIKTREQKELHRYNQKLYNWLKENNIPYKPNDKTKLQVTVTALLLGEYSNIVLQTDIKPRYVSNKVHDKSMQLKFNRAKAKDMTIIYLDEKFFTNLDKLKPLLLRYKN